MSNLTELSKPTHESAPDECAYTSCEKHPTMTIRFQEPKEYVCYCTDHSEQVFQEREYAKYRSKLR